MNQFREHQFKNVNFRWLIVDLERTRVLIIINQIRLNNIDKIRKLEVLNFTIYL